MPTIDVRRHTLCGLLLLGVITSPLTAHADGATDFTTLCAGCHQPDGSGVPGMFPPLAKRLAPWLATDAGRHYVGQVILNGRYGAITVGDQRYEGFMPPWGHLSDQQIADLINHVATHLNQTDGYVAVDATTISQWRQKPVRDAELDALRAALKP